MSELLYRAHCQWNTHPLFLSLHFGPHFSLDFPLFLCLSLLVTTCTHSGLQEVGSHAGHVNMPPSDLGPNTRKRAIWGTLLTHTHTMLAGTDDLIHGWYFHKFVTLLHFAPSLPSSWPYPLSHPSLSFPESLGNTNGFVLED
jgi:hypothetical protein